MPIPDTIPLSSIDYGHRARTSHDDIEALANDIADSGLIQPIVLVEKTPQLVAEYEAQYKVQLDSSKPYLLTAGGRRSLALEILEYSLVYHGATSDPSRPGFVLRSEAPLLDQIILEIKENNNRHQMDWRDELRSIVHAYRIAKRQTHEEGMPFVDALFGITLGVHSQKVTIANLIYDHFMANPELYKDVDSMFSAYSIMLRAQSNELARVLVTRQIANGPTLVPKPTLNTSFYERQPDPNAVIEQSERPATPDLAPRLVQLKPGQSPIMAIAVEDQVLPLSSAFLNTNGLDFMASMPEGFCDHIVTDPDYALSVKALNSNPNNRKGLMKTGVAQPSVEESLSDLERLMPLAFRAIAEHGFFCFWYAMDHHNRLQDAAKAAGFRVQPWPLIWNKMDFRGRANAAPNHNFPHSYETCMVCRKPGTVLRKVQIQSVYTAPADSVVKELGHPFAKPYAIWKWIYDAISIPGQIIFDPFVGSGSSAIAGMNYNVRMMGTEIQPDVYNSLILNLQRHARKLFGDKVKFS